MLYGEEYGKMPTCSCGNRKPQQHGCVDCQRSYCEQCAAVIDGDLVCSACVAKRADAIEEAEPEMTFQQREAAARAEAMRNAPTVHDMAWFYKWLDAPKGQRYGG